MTAAELAQAFRDAGEERAYWLMQQCFDLRPRDPAETAALAIAEARVMETWRIRGELTWQHVQLLNGQHYLRLYLPKAQPVPIECVVRSYDYADCLYAALQAALECTR